MSDWLAWLDERVLPWVLVASQLPMLWDAAKGAFGKGAQNR